MSVAARLTRLFSTWPVAPSDASVETRPRMRVLPSIEAVADGSSAAEPADFRSAVGAEVSSVQAAATDPTHGGIEIPTEPGFADLEAAVQLVLSGLATHIVLSGFRSWPGLLWQAYELSRETGVSIVTRPGGVDGRLEIDVTRDDAQGD